MSVAESLSVVSADDVAKLRRMSIPELCHFIWAFSTMIDVGTAMLSTPGMEGRKDFILNGAGDLLDDRVSEMLRLREAAFAILRPQKPDSCEAEQYAAMMTMMQFEVGADAADIEQTVADYAASEGRVAAREEGEKLDQSEIARLWEQFRSTKISRSVRNAQSKHEEAAFGRRQFASVRAIEASTENTVEAAAVRVLLSIWWGYSAIDADEPDLKRKVGILRTLQPMLSGVVADDVAATINALEGPEPCDLDDLAWFA